MRKLLENGLINKGIRDKIVVTTKGAHPDLSTMDVQRLSFEEIKSDLEESLVNLSVDKVDLYWLHRDDANRNVKEIIDSLEYFVQKGMIRYYACSNWSTERIEEANSYARSINALGFTANQMMWSLAKPKAEALFDKNMKRMTDAMKDMHKRTKIAAIPYSAQANGYFSMMDNGIVSDIPSDMLEKYDSDINRGRYRRIKELTMKYETTIPSIVLSYLMNQAFTVIPTAGFENFEQMNMLLKDVDVKLTQEDLDYLDG